MTREDLVSANRSFALVLAGGFGALAAIRYALSGAIPWWLVVLAVAFLAAALLAPAELEPLRRGWMKLAAVLGAVNGRILLTLLFALLITPMALLLRLLGKRPMALAWDRAAPTYWRERKAEEFAPARMERQF